MRAMVLCAGYGTRLAELTRDVPKPMLPVNGRPMLELILLNLVHHGFRRIAINLHFMPEVIRAHFGNGAPWGAELVYSHEPELLGTAGGVRQMAEFLAAEGDFLVQYGDVVTDQDLSALREVHRQHQALATLLLHQRPNSNSVVSLDAEQRIVGFLERPSDAERAGVASPWVNSGVCICAPEVLDLIPAEGACDLPRDVFVKHVSGGRLFGLPLTGQRVAVDSPRRLDLLRDLAASGRLRIASPGMA
ncbi:MAG: hypothetical protein A3K19_09205 [Lentisphaerae bacterium RIFOXYB12_FULL_65_16]|nr:MAG: hypothetical protein A3K18_14675 [Lentisphaerae bacterium RIFOXYA12_64_32]OGV90363.1 MAG: hypothetical protein A3K19_09205 [Lentisphaerae bacterium RIFOXYB12_FULL_65_16]